MLKDIEWICPECGTENIDTYGATAEPMCECCFHEPGWDWILAQPRLATMADVVSLLAPLGLLPRIITEKVEDE